MSYATVYYIIGGIAALWMIKTFVLDYIEKWFNRRQKISTSAAEITRLQAEVEIMKGALKDVADRAAVLEAKQDKAFVRIDESREDMRGYTIQTRETLNLIGQALSALIDCQLQDGNNKEALRNVKSRLDARKNIV